VSAYVIYEAEIIDPVRYEDYRAKTAASLAAAGARYIVCGGIWKSWRANLRRAG